MNYKNIYKSIIVKAKQEHRAKTVDSYYEKHHIIPDFMFKNRKRTGKPGHLDGNPNDKSNIVLLTPREHFICHVLLYKFLQRTRYANSAGSAIQFFFSKVINKHPRSNFQLTDSKWYSKCREIGIQSISKARKGKVPVKDAVTGVKIGSVDRNHVKVLSGEWVHHTKGRVMLDDERRMKKEQVSGTGNPRYSGKTDDDIYQFAREFYVPRGYMDKKEFELACLQNGIPTMRGTSSPNKKCFRFCEYGGGYIGLIAKLSLEFGEIYQKRTNFKEYIKAKEAFNAKNN